MTATDKQCNGKVSDGCRFPLRCFIYDNGSPLYEAAFLESHFDIRIRVLGSPSTLRTIARLSLSHVIDFANGSAGKLF